MVTKEQDPRWVVEQIAAYLELSPTAAQTHRAIEQLTAQRRDFPRVTSPVSD